MIFVKAKVKIQYFDDVGEQTEKEFIEMKKWMIVLVMLIVVLSLIIGTLYIIKLKSDINANENIEEAVDESKLDSKSVLEELYDSYVSGDKEVLERFINNDKRYSKMYHEIKENEFLWYSETNSLKEKNTLGIAIYNTGLLYIGDWYNNKFDGIGKYYIERLNEKKELERISVEGVFCNGAPNGYCEEIIYVNTKYGNKEDGEVKTFKGNYINGLRSGDFEYTILQEHLGFIEGRHLFILKDLNYVDGVAQATGSTRYGDYVALSQYITNIDGGESQLVIEYSGEREYAAGFSDNKRYY